MTVTAINPPLIDALGQPTDIRLEDAIEAHEPGVGSAYATAALPPLGWNHGKPDSSRMVGWTLHRGGRLIAQHAFSINPQAITRVPSSRNQMFATQDAFYVDDFGPGSETVQLTQKVAHGRATAGGGGSIIRATAREDVLRFYDEIYVKATANPGQVLVYFHDNHLWNQPNGRTPELVYFPSQALQIVRSVDQHNVWVIQLTMMTLVPRRKPPSQGQIPGQPKIRVHVVRKGETLTKIAAKLAGRRATHKRILQLQQQVVALTKKYGDDDITKNRKVPTFSTSNPQQVTGLAHITRNHIAPGEKIILPAA